MEPGRESAITYWKARTEPAERGCIRWKGPISGEGYGYTSGASALGYHIAHRLSYVLFRGEIPTGKTIDHLCRNRWCQNPDHLEAVSIKENVLRGVGPTAICARRQHCAKGHPYTPETMYRRPDGTRLCRICRRAQDKRRTDRQRLEREASGRSPIGQPEDTPDRPSAKGG